MANLLFWQLTKATSWSPTIYLAILQPYPYTDVGNMDPILLGLLHCSLQAIFGHYLLRYCFCSDRSYRIGRSCYASRILGEIQTCLHFRDQKISLMSSSSSIVTNHYDPEAQQASSQDCTIRTHVFLLGSFQHDELSPIHDVAGIAIL